MTHPARLLAAATTLALSGLAAIAQTPPDAPAAAPAAAAPCATVEVHNVRPQQGFLMLAAYGDAESFGKKPLLSLRVPAGDAITTVQVCGLTVPTVSLTLYQDLDSDGKMGRNLMGMPTEPWGASGSPGAFGPSWDNSKVTLDGKPLIVRMSQ